MSATVIVEGAGGHAKEHFTTTAGYAETLAALSPGGVVEIDCVDGRRAINASRVLQVLPGNDEEERDEQIREGTP